MLSEVECRAQQDAALRAVRGDEREPVALPPEGVEFCQLAENGHRTLLLSLAMRRTNSPMPMTRLSMRWPSFAPAFAVRTFALAAAARA